ncbi:hypothetical protein HASA104033_00995 [Halobacterium salinarum]|uniref:Uncharacterized protein n=4 Tax=Halobacterium salinarum TaxID=2242 RepID=Q9HNX3_HALSA|nr:hypothetical protein VNG_1904H [Halobacterium salinarum NRC-1]MBB6089109.1 hypothetical protein [Halobacterium salinarum]QCC45580.1 uncharacterized protein HBSAL_09680 [Halobacterium salinarum]CAP14391.1 uncharacterized protein OE_3680R [Halobacterium salinarum R1]DAC78834.1 TPA_inf: uncharacterized protein VNG_1904H [Halobacterium salinarum NRC-1]
MAHDEPGSPSDTAPDVDELLGDLPYVVVWRARP